MSKSKYEMQTAARFFAVQALFQMEASDQSLEDVKTQFRDYRFGEKLEEGEMREADLDLFEMLLKETVAQQARIDQNLNTVLDESWPIARIDPVLRALFRAACAEFLGGTTPSQVVINEYIEIARSFFDEGREIKFTNAVLDAIAKKTF